MRIRHLAITNFRGIQTLEWDLSEQFVCLIGPGDSCKSTILAAIQHLFLPATQPPAFTESDFFACDPANEIEIRAIVDQLSGPLENLERGMGTLEMGINPDGVLSDEPDPDHEFEPCLEVSLKVDSEFEFHWTAQNSRTGDREQFGASQRRKFGVGLIGAPIDRNFSWDYRSALHRLTDTDENPIGPLRKEISRLAESLRDVELKDYADVATKVAGKAKAYGFSARSELGASVDSSKLKITTTGVSLHDGAVPVRAMGTGSRNLLSLAMQRMTSDGAGISLIDEIESGLEPHRIYQLMNALRSELADQNGQVFLTTHSPIPILEAPSNGVFVVRNNDGEVTINQVPDELDTLRRSQPLAWLSDRPVITEGKTEWHLLRGLDRSFAENTERLPFAAHQVAVIDGGGCTKAPDTALRFQELGYSATVFGDSDQPFVPNEDVLRDHGVQVFQWPDGLNTEQVLCRDLPLQSLVETLHLLSEVNSIDALKIRFATEAEVEVSDLSGNFEEWMKFCQEDIFRSAMGTALHKASWIKNHNAEVVAKTIFDTWNELDGTGLRTLLEDLLNSIHAVPSATELKAE